MPTRHDFQRLIEWCDRDAPFDWLKASQERRWRFIQWYRSAPRARVPRHSGLVTSRSARYLGSASFQRSRSGWPAPW